MSILENEWKPLGGLRPIQQLNSPPNPLTLPILLVKNIVDSINAANQRPASGNVNCTECQPANKSLSLPGRIKKAQVDGNKDALFWRNEDNPSIPIDGTQAIRTYENDISILPLDLQPNAPKYKQRDTLAYDERTGKYLKKPLTILPPNAANVRVNQLAQYPLSTTPEQFKLNGDIIVA